MSLHVTLHKPSMFFMWKIDKLKLDLLKASPEGIEDAKTKTKNATDENEWEIKRKFFWSPSFLIFLLSRHRLALNFLSNAFSWCSFSCAVYRIVTSTCLISTFDFFSLDLFFFFLKPFTQHSSPFLLSRRSPTFFSFSYVLLFAAAADADTMVVATRKRIDLLLVYNRKGGEKNDEELWKLVFFSMFTFSIRFSFRWHEQLFMRFVLENQTLYKILFSLDDAKTTNSRNLPFSGIHWAVSNVINAFPPNPLHWNWKISQHFIDFDTSQLHFFIRHGHNKSIFIRWPFVPRIEVF